MKQKFSIVTLLALFGASFLFPGAHAALATERDGENSRVREVVVGDPLAALVLPVANGGTPPLTYSVSGLPEGLSFDADIRTISGMPMAVGLSEVVYTVTDANGASRSVPFTVSVVLPPQPVVFSLADNYPNPFNPQTTIQYALPQAADVMLTVYNVVGQPVRTLVAEHQAAGRYAVEWDATNDSGHSVSSGMYFYRLQAGGDFLDIKKMLLLK